MRRAPAAIVLGAMGVLVLGGPRPARGADPDIARALLAALPVAGGTDVVVIDRPPVPGAPRVRGATRVNAPPDAVRAVLVDAAHYAAVIPSIVKSQVQPNVQPSGPGVSFVDWELEVPLFNLSGRFALRAAGDQVRLDLFEGDFAPGHLVFTIAPAPGGGATLMIDASMDVRRSSWILRRILKRSPYGEPAALAAAAYVALRGVALRAEHPNGAGAWRPTVPPGPPADWQPDARALAAAPLAPARAAGVVALVARRPDDRLAGVAAGVDVARSADALAPALRDPQTWRAFPGLRKVQLLPGPGAPSAHIEDDLPLMDLDATYAPQAPMRWVAVDGATRGARLGWTVVPQGGHGATLALSSYPRLETSGSIARRFMAAEPLLEAGLALAVAFANVISTGVALDSTR